MVEDRIIVAKGRSLGKTGLAGFYMSVLLAGCASSPPSTVEVKVPIPVKCTVVPVTKPVMPFDTSAKPTMTIFDKTKLLVAQDLRHKAYEAQLEAALNSCTSGPSLLDIAP